MEEYSSENHDRFFNYKTWIYAFKELNKNDIIFYKKNNELIIENGDNDIENEIYNNIKVKIISDVYKYYIKFYDNKIFLTDIWCPVRGFLSYPYFELESEITNIQLNKPIFEGRIGSINLLKNEIYKDLTNYQNDNIIIKSMRIGTNRQVACFRLPKN